MDKSTVSSSAQSVGSDTLIHTLTNDARLGTIETDTKDGETVDGNEAVPQQPLEPNPGPGTQSERNMLQDQSNRLPMKQLIVVFAGLSCALFCEFYKTT
jgi:hypothetical protein